MYKQIRFAIKDLLWGSLLSYPQVFFSKSKLFAIFIFLISFTFPHLGTSGLICIISSLFFALIFKFNRNYIKSGYYGYNALLVGLGLGAYYSFNVPLFIVLVFSGFLTLLVQVFIERIFYKYSLPVLSLPFVLALWIVLLATRQSQWLNLSEHNIFIFNNLFSIGGSTLVQSYDWLNQFLSKPLYYYFLSLGSIFFQDNVLAGIILFAGLLLFSRIATTLSLIGFFVAYYFMYIIGINVDNINYFFVGFNFILTSIAIGSIYLIPNIYSYIWILFLMPVNVMFTLGLADIFSIWQLSIYSLPFNLIVLFFLMGLRNRSEQSRRLIETTVQELMPEKNLYLYLNYRQKQQNNPLSIHLYLPFWGEWTVWQGYNGKHTHKDLYRHALDFVITFRGKTYRNNGAYLDDYYTYNKQVCSPGNGWVVKILDEVEDNPIGDVNTIHNWGNSIVIKHAENLYTQLSHLKKGSFKVNEGDYVKTGQPIAHVGNSGRSPEPHLHMQVQAYPTIGSPTIQYPISRFLTIEGNTKHLNINTIPKENEQVENITILTNFSKAFHFIPGMHMEVYCHSDKHQSKHEWEIFTDSYNRTYIYSHTTHSFAYIYKDELTFYFTSYHGKKSDPLYQFYLYCYHIEFAYINNYHYEESYPLHHIFPFYKTFIQDFFAPFFRFMKASYKVQFKNLSLSSPYIQFTSAKEEWIFGKKINQSSATITIENQQLKSIENQEHKMIFTYKNKY